MSVKAANIAKAAVVGSAAIGLLVLPGCLPTSTQSQQEPQQQDSENENENAPEAEVNTNISSQRGANEYPAPLYGPAEPNANVYEPDEPISDLYGPAEPLDVEDNEDFNNVRVVYGPAESFEDEEADSGQYEQGLSDIPAEEASTSHQDI